MYAFLALTYLTATASAAVMAERSAPKPTVGSAIIQNKCPYSVYLWPVDQSRNPQNPVVIGSKGTWQEKYHVPKPAGGVSLKISRTPQLVDITQFEYTLAAGTIWYDGSNVDCKKGRCPFEKSGITLTPSNKACPKTRCAPGEAPCHGFYTLYNDDVNSLACGQTAGLTMVLCSG
jgi:hypothetical protein